MSYQTLQSIWQPNTEGQGPSGALYAVYVKLQVSFVSEIFSTLFTEETGHYSHCNYCGNSFTQAGDFKKHKTDPCKILSKFFTEAGILKSHELILRRENPNVCKYCDEPYTWVGDLTRHELIHNGVNSYVCE